MSTKSYLQARLDKFIPVQCHYRSLKVDRSSNNLSLVSPLYTGFRASAPGTGCLPRRW